MLAWTQTILAKVDGMTLRDIMNVLEENEVRTSDDYARFRGSLSMPVRADA